MRESIENPQARIVTGFGPIMPTFQGQVSPEQLIQLMSFIKSLQVTGAPAASDSAGSKDSTVTGDRDQCGAKSSISICNYESNRNISITERGEG